LFGACPVLAQPPDDDEAKADRAAEPDDVLINEEVIAQLEEGEIPDLVFAWMVENPASGITRVPVANAVLIGLPPNDRVGYAFILAPIIPILFKGGWSLITRTIIPAVVTVPVGDNRVTGFGDMSFEPLAHKLIRGRKGQLYDVSWGAFAGFPTATDDFLGSGQWELGPEVVLGVSGRRWVTILVARNVWSVGNRNRPDVNELVLDYLLFYNLPKLFYLVYEPTITADWTASQGDQWTLPLGIGFGRHHRLPKRPRLSLTTRLSGLYNVVRTDRDPKATVLFTLVFWKPNPAVFISD
jgi:hypothetical protein